MRISSSAFTEGANIPRKYTCEEDNISPPLEWTDVPSDAASLALIVDDPDAPSGTFTHWVLFNLPPNSSGLPEGVRGQASLPGGSVQGTNSARQGGYRGPCPPGGTPHRYYFRLYALNTDLSLQVDATAGDLQSAMQGRVLAEASLMGRYQR